MTRKWNTVRPGWYGSLSLVLLLWSVLTLSACGFGGLPGLQPRANASPTLSSTAAVSQWAATATASSQYGLPDWSPNRATGAPDVNACSDDARAWASARGNGVEWLELRYNRPVHASEVRVYQTFGRGAVSRITLIDVDGGAQIVWEGEDTTTPCPGALVTRMEPTAARVVTVRIDLDESRIAFWNQIDAVELIGIP